MFLLQLSQPFGLLECMHEVHVEHDYPIVPKYHQEYLQEILYKTYSALINEFYRILWRADNETVKLIGEKCEELQSKMTDETLRKCSTAQKDIGSPVFDKNQIAEKPFVSVVAKKCTKEFIDSLYAQSMPVFELVTETKDIPECENIRIGGKKAARGRIIVCCNGKTPLDARSVKYLFIAAARR